MEVYGLLANRYREHHGLPDNWEVHAPSAPFFANLRAGAAKWSWNVVEEAARHCKAGDDREAIARPALRSALSAGFAQPAAQLLQYLLQSSPMVSDVQLWTVALACDEELLQANLRSAVSAVVWWDLAVQLSGEFNEVAGVRCGEKLLDKLAHTRVDVAINHLDRAGRQMLDESAAVDVDAQRLALVDVVSALVTTWSLELQNHPLIMKKAMRISLLFNRVNRFPAWFDIGAVLACDCGGDVELQDAWGLVMKWLRDPAPASDVEVQSAYEDERVVLAHQQIVEDMSGTVDEEMDLGTSVAPSDMMLAVSRVLAEAGHNTGDRVSTRVTSGLVKLIIRSLPWKQRWEAQSRSFAQGLTNSEADLCHDVVTFLGVARGIGVFGDPGDLGDASGTPPALSDDILFAAAERCLARVMLLGDVREELQNSSELLYAIVAIHCLCCGTQSSRNDLESKADRHWLQTPNGFDKLAATYLEMQGLPVARSPSSSPAVDDVRELAHAYASGAVARFVTCLTQAGELDMESLEEIVCGLELRGTDEHRSPVRIGQMVRLGSYQEVSEAATKVRLPVAQRAAFLRGFVEARCTVKDISDASPQMVLVQNRSLREIWLRTDCIQPVVLDTHARPIIVTTLRDVLRNSPAPTSEEIECFAEQLDEALGPVALRRTIRVIACWDLADRLGKEVFVALQSHAFAVGQQLLLGASKGDCGTGSSLEANLYCGVILGAIESPEFEAAADRYRSDRGLPDFWSVREMLGSYESSSPDERKLWRRAEHAIKSDGDGLEELLRESSEDHKDKEPWRSLIMWSTSNVPKHWNLAGCRGSFDKLFAIPRRDALGRPVALYPLMQKLLDDTWKFIPTRDRPCPKRTDPCASRAGGCRCVQKDGNPGMPTGLRVRRILRVEDSQMWESYHAKRQEIADCRRGETLLDLSTKTKDSVGHTEYFEPLDNVAPSNECYLFHGTFVRAALNIAQNNFRIDLAGSHVGTMYGRGAYFCECCSKADEYARDEPDGYYEGMFAIVLCRVAMGQPFVTEERDEHAGEHVKAGRFDSTLGDREKSVNTYREFVVYNLDQVYPEYVILYERVGRGYEYGGDSWGALRRMNSKVVLEVPCHWRNAHVDPSSESFSEMYQVSRGVIRLLDSVSRRSALAAHGSLMSIMRASRIEDSAMWLTYLDRRRVVQQRGCEAFPSSEGDLAAASEIRAAAAEDDEVGGAETALLAVSPSATVRALFAELMRKSARPMCRFGDKCYRKSRVHRLENSHPGDTDWDGGGGDTPKGGSDFAVEDVAAMLLESMDSTINETLLWCAVPSSSALGLADGGFGDLFTRVGGKQIITLYGSPVCAAASIPKEERKTGITLILCRALLGTSKRAILSDIENSIRGAGEVVDSFSGSNEVGDLLPISQQCFLLRRGNVYPEYAVDIALHETSTEEKEDPTDE
eukprot:TRINITY_DN74851_c0_g1_i1.p1 TRINITY_DN74851_c0_g1~~TRINITY_DN74851_c0_g1_i1.p1  ORF type:complete len:1591 (-),score=283.88 TRINITY_DN74851_c0_g1_i1:245-4540(-)